MRFNCYEYSRSEPVTTVFDSRLSKLELIRPIAHKLVPNESPCTRNAPI